MGNTSRERDPRTTGNQHLGRAIRGLRRDRALTLTQLSESSGLSVPFLSQVENNRANPSLQSLAAIATALGCSTIDILTAARADCFVDVSRAQSTDGDRRMARQGAQVQVDELTRDPGTGQDWQTLAHDVVLYVVAGAVSVDVVDGGAEVNHALGPRDRLLCSGGVAFRWQTAPASGEQAVVVLVRVDGSSRF